MSKTEKIGIYYDFTSTYYEFLHPQNNEFMFDQVGSKASVLFPKQKQKKQKKQQSDPTRNWKQKIHISFSKELAVICKL